MNCLKDDITLGEFDEVQIDYAIKDLASQAKALKDENDCLNSEAKLVDKWQVNTYKQIVVIKKKNQSKINELKTEMIKLELLKRRYLKSIAQQHNHHMIGYNRVLSKIEHDKDDQMREHIKTQRDQYMENRRNMKDFFCEKHEKVSTLKTELNAERKQQIFDDCQKDRFDFKD